MSTLKEVIAAIVNLAISERIVKLVRYSLLISFNLVVQIAYDFFFPFQICYPFIKEFLASLVKNHSPGLENIVPYDNYNKISQMCILLPITFLQLQFFTRELAPSQNSKQKWITICQTFDEDLLNYLIFLFFLIKFPWCNISNSLKNNLKQMYYFYRHKRMYEQSMQEQSKLCQSQRKLPL